MTSYKRFRNRWTINECLQLQREFELLELSIDEIAERHQRSPNAIMFRLDHEGFADYNILYSNYHHLNIQMCSKVNHHEEEEQQDDEQQDDEQQDDYDSEEEDQDDSSNYSDSDNHSVSDSEDEQEDEEDDSDLNKRVIRLEQKISDLTELLIQYTSKNNKSVFSLFS
jgi:cobalamin biosynthesis protein CobT